MTIDRPLVVIGNPQGLRVRLLSEALAGLGWPPPRLIAYADLLAGRGSLADLPLRAIIRLESPGKDFEVEKLLLRRGFAEAQAEGSPVIAPTDIDELEFDRGRIWFPRQWYLGFRDALRAWHTELRAREDILLTAWPPDVETLFDKCRCHARCKAGGVPVPQAIQPISCCDELLAQMEERHWDRVFVKLAHGSSASGALALQRHRGGLTAFTTVESVVAGGEPRLYNTRPVRTITEEKQVRQLIDALAPHRLHTEQWLPKASLGKRLFDLRVVVIAGRPRHTVVREGRSPITNLQLGNRRGSLAALRDRLPTKRWHALQATCSLVGELHPRSLHLGVDVLLPPGLHDHFVLEVNAFGDLLPRALDKGQSTFEAELTHLANDWPSDSGDPSSESPGR